MNSATNRLPCPENIADFSVSKLGHFELFKGLPFQSYNVGDPDPVICDLKVYQDYLMYCFIVANVPKGSRILDVGGGDSRVLKFFSKDYECWNVDKCEGLGNGPVRFTSPHYRIVYDYLGTGNPELPDQYFDFVFSISALEHTPEDPAIREGIVKDINRILKPGCPSFHLFDCIWRPNGKTWINGLIPHFYRTTPVRTRFESPEESERDADTFFMSEKAFDSSWGAILKTNYRDYGRPYSQNVFWTR